MLKRLIRSGHNLFFYHFYRDLAWSYNLVSKTVSLGLWNDWIRMVIPYLRGPIVLELGHGTGHLQQTLLSERTWTIVGLDESRQMGLLTKVRMARAGSDMPNLTRAVAGFLPFPEQSFESVVATFPTTYIFDLNTLVEVKRVLHAEGRLVILPAAWISWQRRLFRRGGWEMRETQLSSRIEREPISERLINVLEQVGFKSECHTFENLASTVIVVIAHK